MISLEVTSAGVATSVQDAGRFGAQRYGLAPSGAMDRLSLAAANALVRNAPFDAAIEIGPLPASFTARGGGVRIAVTGALRTATRSAQLAPLYESMLLDENETLSLGAAREGVFSYLAVASGLKGDAVFGSLSVNARAGLGSPFPRALRNGDRLPVSSAQSRLPEIKLFPPVFHSGPIRVVMGPQDDEFANKGETFLDAEWRVLPTSDRMGYRLAGPHIAHHGGFNIVSDGTVDGSIQITGQGQPIVLMKDRGTTGGYPKIATIISADLGRFAQTRPNRSLRFEAIGVDEAQREARSFHRLLHSLSGHVMDVQ